MEVLVAQSAGFCFGVKRAIDLAEKTAAVGPASTYGPLIHNRQVVEYLEQRGLQAVNELESSEGRIIIRSHGAAPEVYEQSRELKLEVVDATCPFVSKAQSLAAAFAREGRQVVVVGDRSHPEVQGIIGWTGNQAIVVQDSAEASLLPHLGRVAVLAQTTQPQANFQAVVETLREKNPDLVEQNTICSATGERQRAAKDLACQVQVMVVIGGQESANTKKLAKICAETGTPTFQVETAEDLELGWFVGVQRAGLTAGASTPDWIIEEVFRKMTEINEPGAPKEPETDFEDMSSWEESLQNVQKGEVVSGTVVSVTPDEVLVDIGSKSEGVIPLKELAVKTPAHPSEVVKVGDQFKVMVLRMETEDGYPLLSKRRADQLGAVDGIQDAFETGRELKASVVEVVKGGLLVDIGMRGFVPASQIQRGFVEDLNQFLGQTLRLRVLELDRQKNKVVLSQRVVLEEEAKLAAAGLWEKLEEGQVVQGTVRRLTNFGAFVDIGGLDGLLHISDMTYGRIKHPSEIVKEGDEIKVAILKLDREKQRVSLGYKQTMPSPWDAAAEKYAVGSLVTGTVVRTAPFGAFVKLDDAIDGLIHISQLSDRRIAKPEEVVQVGQEVTVKVIEFKPEERRISLSLKAAVTEVQNQEAAQTLENQPDDFRATIGETIGHAVEKE